MRTRWGGGGVGGLKPSRWYLKLLFSGQKNKNKKKPSNIRAKPHDIRASTGGNIRAKRPHATTPPPPPPLNETGPVCLWPYQEHLFFFFISVKIRKMQRNHRIGSLCKNEALKKMHLKRQSDRGLSYSFLPIDCCVKINGKPDHLFSGDIQSQISW